MMISLTQFVTKECMKQYDPNWPFPQFDEDGVQLLPAEKVKESVDLSQCEEAPF